MSKNKENFLKVYHRLKEVTEKINSDKDINQNFKYGFNHCMALIKNHAYEFEAVNVMLENKRLTDEVKELKLQLSSAKGHMITLLDSVKKSKTLDCTNMSVYKTIINGVDIEFESNISAEMLTEIRTKMEYYIMSTGKKTRDENRYRNKAVNYLRERGYKCI